MIQFNLIKITVCYQNLTMCTNLFILLIITEKRFTCIQEGSGINKAGFILSCRTQENAVSFPEESPSKTRI